MHYTYLVDHGDKTPSVGAALDIQGGKLVSVSFYDAMEELDRLREALEETNALFEQVDKAFTRNDCFDWSLLREQIEKNQAALNRLPIESQA